MAGEGLSSHGTIVARQPGGSGAFTDVGGLFDVTPPPLTKPSTETTPHNLKIDTYVMGVKRRGEMTINVNFDQTDVTHDEAAGLVKSFIDGSLDGWRITYLDGHVWLFSGYLANIPVVTPGREGAQQAAVTIRPSGTMQINAVDIAP